MDVFRLDEETYEPISIVEDLSTKIWTERFKELGEFEFRSNRIEIARKALPENSLVSLRQTDVVMMVETHSIEADGDVGQVVVIKGREAPAILESRAWAGARYGKKAKMRQKYSIPTAIMVFIQNVLNNKTTVDLVSKSATGKPNPLNNIPNFRITDGTTRTYPSKTRYVENTQAWTYVQDQLGAGKMGVRMIRPRSGDVKRKTIHVTAAGIVTRPLEDHEGRLTMEIYDGENRSDSQKVRPAVVFSYAGEDITSPTYLFSSQNYKECAIVISASGPVGKGKEVDRIFENEAGDVKQGPSGRPRGGNGSGTIAPGEPHGGGFPVQPPSGFTRREVLIDAGSKEDGDTKAEFLASLPDVGSDALKANYERITSIDSGISPFTKYVYKKDYDLGDRVTMLGQFGISQDMLVNEYTRAEDGEGERGYPGLILWNTD